jgi:shikimate kinase
VDGDAVLEAQTTRTGAQIVEAEGVEHLHRLERQILLDALSRDEPAVIAPAACVVEDEHCVAELGRHATVGWLDLPLDELHRRMARGEHRRTMEPEELHARLARRRPFFAAVADVHLDATAPTGDLVEAIMTYLERASEPPSATEAGT